MDLTLKFQAQWIALPHGWNSWQESGQLGSSLMPNQSRRVIWSGLYWVVIDVVIIMP